MQFWLTLRWCPSQSGDQDHSEVRQQEPSELQRLQLYPSSTAKDLLVAGGVSFSSVDSVSCLITRLKRLQLRDVARYPAVSGHQMIHCGPKCPDRSKMPSWHGGATQTSSFSSGFLNWETHFSFESYVKQIQFKCECALELISPRESHLLSFIFHIIIC